jgi:CcmD family protein
MMKNFWYLFAAFTIVWTGICVYAVRLSKRNQQLQAELRELQTRVEHFLSQKEGGSNRTEV